MSPTDSKHLQQLVQHFDVINLGEGDQNTGINTLASMLCTLANVARPGSGIRTPEGKVFPVGASLLVNGIHSASLVNDLVSAKLRVSQNNLIEHLRRLVEAKLNDKKRPKHEQIGTTPEPKANLSEEALLSLQDPDNDGLFLDGVKWAQALSCAPNPRIEDLAQRPKTVITASTPAELKKQLVGIHQGHALVLLGLNKDYRSEGSNRLLKAIIDGSQSHEHYGETIRGNLLVTDPDDALVEIAKTSNDSWLGRTLWLLDGNAGPESPPTQPGATASNISGIFDMALGIALGKRLNMHNPGAVMYSADLSAAQTRWVSFLKQQEVNLPGITGTARKLFATLLFGFAELCNVKGSTLTMLSAVHVEALARFLVHRMANARTAILYSAREVWKREKKEGILQRLKEGPHTVTALTRRFNKIDAAPCRELLFELEEAGKVICEENQWCLPEQTRRATPATLEI